MAKVIRTNFSEEVEDIIYDRQADLTRTEKRNVTISEAIESLLKDAYLEKVKEQK